MGKNKKVEVSLSDLQEFINTSVKTVVNGKIDRVADHLKKQDKDLAELKGLLTAAKVIFKAVAWTFGTVVSIGGAYLLYTNIIQTF